MWARLSRFRPAERRLTAVLDNGGTCPGVFAEYDMPSLIVCGDGYMDVHEACEDGNTDDGDGCSAACGVEPGWTCGGAVASPATGNPISACTRAAVVVEPAQVALREGGAATLRVRLTTFADGVVFVQPSDLPEEVVVEGDTVLRWAAQTGGRIAPASKRRYYISKLFTVCMHNLVPQPQDYVYCILHSRLGWKFGNKKWDRNIIGKMR